MTSYEHKVKNIYLGSPRGGSHIPSSSEFLDLKSIMDGLSLTTANDYKVKLHMPYVGSRSKTDANNSSQGSTGIYWSSSKPTTPTGFSSNFYLNSSTNNAYTASAHRAAANSVRLFKDEYVEPGNTWTVITGSLGSAGIFYNTTYGLISITNGTDKNITMKDKNEGATTVYNDGDTLTEANMGKMFQRGNYYGFPSTGNVSKTSTTRVSTAGYGGNNPYYKDTFIIVSSSSLYDWSNPSNDNLRANSKEEYFVIE